MAIKYKVVEQKQPGVKGGGQSKYYARICGRTTTDIDSLAREIGLATTVCRGDLYGVIINLLDSIPGHLLEGRNVSLGKFGTFSLSLTSKPSDTEDGVTSSNIVKVNIQFRPGPEFKEAMLNARFKKSE